MYISNYIQCSQIYVLSTKVARTKKRFHLISSSRPNKRFQPIFNFQMVIQSFYGLQRLIQQHVTPVQLMRQFLHFGEFLGIFCKPFLLFRGKVHDFCDITINLQTYARKTCSSNNYRKNLPLWSFASVRSVPWLPNLHSRLDVSDNVHRTCVVAQDRDVLVPQGPEQLADLT